MNINFNNYYNLLEKVKNKKSIEGSQNWILLNNNILLKRHKGGNKDSKHKIKMI